MITQNKINTDISSLKQAAKILVQRDVASNSPDANPLDYSTCGEMEAKASWMPHKSVDDLKDSIYQEWAAMSKEFVVKSCRSSGAILRALLIIRVAILKSKVKNIWDCSIQIVNFLFLFTKKWIKIDLMYIMSSILAWVRLVLTCLN